MKCMTLSCCFTVYGPSSSAQFWRQFLSTTSDEQSLCTRSTDYESGSPEWAQRARHALIGQIVRYSAIRGIAGASGSSLLHRIAAGGRHCRPTYSEAAECDAIRLEPHGRATL